VPNVEARRLIHSRHFCTDRRRLNELKAERAALAVELQESTEKLKMIHEA
jgi:hypothetical protein